MDAGVIGTILGSIYTERRGAAALERVRHRRLGDLVSYARRHSPLLSELYGHLPEEQINLASLPVTSKSVLMDRFDEWVTDRNVHLEDVRNFIAQPGLIGERYRRDYIAATTSGTTGEPGVFLLDAINRRATAAWSTRAFGSWLLEGGALKAARQGFRMAVVAATGAHFVVATTTAAIKNSSVGSHVAIIPAQAPLTEIVEQLNGFKPAILSGYASIISLLAYEQAAGRLQIRPSVVMPGSESVSGAEIDRIGEVFGAVVRTAYVATECLFMARGCEAGQLHVNGDWVILEPVDKNCMPVGPGVESHTVLVTNLANRVQPIIRYDLGDSVVVKGAPCTCGNPLPAIQVLGRTSELLRIAYSGGARAIAPLVLETAIDSVSGVKKFQLVQTAPTGFRIHLAIEDRTDRSEVTTRVLAKLQQFFAENGLLDINFECSAEPPQQTPGKKYRTIIPLTIGSE